MIRASGEQRYQWALCPGLFQSEIFLWYTTRIFVFLMLPYVPQIWCHIWNVEIKANCHKNRTSSDSFPRENSNQRSKYFAYFLRFIEKRMDKIHRIKSCCWNILVTFCDLVEWSVFRNNLICFSRNRNQGKFWSVFF